jgi:hypothetical protein
MMKPKFDIGAALAILTLLATAAPSVLLPRSPWAEIAPPTRGPGPDASALARLPQRVEALQTVQTQ